MLLPPINILFRTIKLSQQEEQETNQEQPPTNDNITEINRIQQSIEDFSQNISENMQTNLFLIELPLLDPQIMVATQDRPIYVEGYEDAPTPVRQVCHPDQSSFQSPVCIGIGRNAAINENVMISTVVHTSRRLKLGVVMKFAAAGKQVIGIDDGVGIIQSL